MKHKITDETLLDRVATVSTEGRYCKGCYHLEWDTDSSRIWLICNLFPQGELVDCEDNRVMRCEQCLKMFKEQER